MEKRYARAENPGRTLLRTLNYLKYNKGKTVVVIAVALLNVAISLFGTSMLRPVIDDMIEPVIAGLKTMDSLVRGLTILTGVLLSLYTLSFILGIVQMRLMISISQDAVEKMRNDLFDKLQRLPVRFFDSTTHGELMSRFTNDIDLVNEMFTNAFLEILTSSVLLVGILVMLFVTHWLLALIAVALFPVILLIVWFFTKKARRSFDATQRSLGQMNGYIEETLSGQKVIKVFNKESDIEAEYDKLNLTLTRYSYRSQYFSSITIPVVNNFSSLIFILCTLIGSVFAFVAKVNVAGIALTVGTLSSFIAFVRQLNRPLNRTANQLNIIQAALAGAERMFGIMDLEDEPALAVAKWHSEKDEESGRYYWTDGLVSKPVLGDVRFENVSFSYVEGQPILKNISLFAKPGQKIAFVGSTGAGKTTITNLLTRFYDIDAGQITIDGIDLKEINRKSMRRSMALVLQDTHLFSGTIMDNIRYGRLKATDEECIAAAKLAHAHEFIAKLKDGYDTVISGGNDSLSQGQRQLLSIARSAVANPPILILDEATSSIDTRTERLIEQGMDELMAGKTVFVIAHRLSTIRHSNAIMVLEHGEIIERGDHDDLIEQRGRYYSLCTGKFELN